MTKIGGGGGLVSGLSLRGNHGSGSDPVSC